MGTKFRVDSYHLGLAVSGDAAIHLFVQAPATGPATVLTSMLIDGGDSGGQARLRDTMTKIQASGKYTFPTPGTLKFDKVVISHWDKDHWRGIIYAMKEDIEAQMAVTPPPPSAADLEVSFLRYQPGATGHPRTPQTMFYFPAQGWPQNKSPLLVCTTKPTTADPADANLSFTNETTKQTVQVNNVCRVRMEPLSEPNDKEPSLIGLNLITGSDLPPVSTKTTVQNYQGITSPTMLVTANPPAVAGHPGIYIIGASYRTIGPPPAFDIVNEPRGTAKNKSSIACMIMWPAPAAPPPLTPPRLSHYFAGDMHWQQENALVHWTGADGTRGQRGRWVATAKTSHHASKTSTPTNLMSAFNPRHVIASVGEHYGHPSWELLFYLRGWQWNEDADKASLTPLLATQFPYYLIKQRDPTTMAETWIPMPSGADSMAVLYLDAGGTLGTTYRTDVSTMYTQAAVVLGDDSAVGLADPWTEWATAKASGTDGKTWVRDRIASYWSDLSPVPSSAHTHDGSRCTGTNELVTPASHLAWLRIESCDDDALDGSVYVRYMGDTQDSVVWPTAPPTPPAPVPVATPTQLPPVVAPSGTLLIPASANILGKRATISPNPTPPASSKRAKVASREASVWQLAGWSFSWRGTDPDEEDEEDEDEVVGVSSLLKEPGPILPPGGPPQGTPPPLVAPYYYICSSVVQYDAPPPSTTVKQLNSDDPLNDFLSLLHLQGVILKDIPSSSDPIPLHLQDEFQSWLALSLGVGGTDPVTMTATVDTTTNDIEAFALTVPALGLTYSSAGTIHALDVQPNWGLGQASTVPGQCSLILGLQPASKKNNLKLSDVLAVATGRGSTLPGLELMVIALENILTFNLDTSMGSRNAFWFEPMMGYKTVLRCQYAADSPSLVSLNNWIARFLVGFTVQSVTAITKLQSKWVATNKDLAANNKWEFIFTTTVALDGVHVVPSVTFDFKGAELVLTLQFDYTDDGQGSLLGDIMAWIAKQKPMAEVKFDFSHWFQNAGTSNFNLPFFRRLKLSVPLDQKGLPTGSVDNVSVDLELGVKFGQPVVNGKPQRVVFLFTYEWSKARGSLLRGSLWTPPNPDADVNRHFLPEFEPHLDFEPSSISDVSEWAPSLDLTNLIPFDPNSGAPGAKVVKIPDGVPTQIIRAVLELDSDSISFQGSMACQPPKSTDIPPLFLSNISLDASYTFATKDFNLLFSFGAAMNPRQGSGMNHIELLGSLNYDTKAGWDIQASVETPGMQGAHFLDFFDVDAGPTATALIQHIALLYLGLEYKYQNGSGATNPASSFFFSGAIAIGKLELDLHFNYTGKDTWTFSAQAGAEGEESTIQEILDSIIGDGTVDLPSCVGNIPVGKPKPPSPESDGTEAKEFFNLTMTRVKADAGKPNSPQDVIFTVSVNVGPVSFTFLQFRNTSWDLDKTPNKRFLRLEVNQLPQVSIPIIGDLTQPFDEMYFMWVQDGSKSTTPGSPPGLTMAEIGVLNGVLGDDPICYKLNKDPKDYKETDVLVQAGCHFVVVLKDKTGAKNVVLDYVFAQPTPDYSVPSPALALQVHAHYQKLHGPNTVIPSRPWERDAKHKSLILHRTGKRAGRPEADPPPDPEPTGADAGGGTTKAPMKKSIGPFSISNVGVKFSNSKLSVCLDAEVAIGPVAMAMQGFSIDLDFGHGHDLQHKFPTIGDGITISLQGLSADYDRPPLSIAGALLVEHVPTGSTFYAGGVEISFEQWQFLAAGGYGDLTDPLTNKPFKTAFVFAKLNGPLITLEFATIQGITGGFGYNNNLTLPTVAEVPSFPFLNMPTVQPVTGDATMDTLMALVGSKWFSPLDGAFWAGAGLTVSALEMLDITAVLVVEWGLDVKLGIFAVAVCDVPSTDAPAKLAHAELGILATVDFGLGLAKFEAQLAPSSYILDPLCHLSGGFALYYWFKDGPQQTKGDWVFTLGGYHRLYKPPPQYPVPPRLQIEWSLGPLSITGQAYFAMTPNVAMAGGALHAYMGIGMLEAFFDAWIDFLINFKPFWFLGSGGVSVGVRFSLDLLFVTIHISVEIGATLTVYGPSIGGICHVDFWVFGFDIHFGAGQGSGNGAIGVLDFFNLALQKGSPAAVSSAPQPLLFQCQTGMLPSGGAAASERARARQERRRLRRRQLVQSQSRPAPRVVELVGDDGYEVRESDDKAVFEAEAGVSAAVDDDDDDDDDDVPIWEVKGGTFSFAINAVFAISKVTVYPEGKHPVVLDAPPKDTSPIMSRPMHLDKTMPAITSELKVEMKIATGDSKVDYEPQWELQPVISSVPKALWDAYDASTDPMGGSQSMLDTSTGGTVPLMMGVLFVAPKPILSHDKVQPFNAVLSQLQSVFPKAETPPFPDSTTAENKAWLPVPPAKPDPSNPARDWVAVQNAWKEPGLGAGAGAAAAAGWAMTMGWDTGAVDGSVPVRLVEGLQVLYVDAPLVAQAA